jgi:KDEL-tailed cysteine endopeptidase
MQQFLALFALLATASAANLQSREFYEKAFFEHMNKHGLTFKDGAEFTKRLSIFADNHDLITLHNADNKATYKMGLNRFSHLTFDEFIDAVRIGGTRTPNLRRNRSSNVHSAPKDVTTLASDIDWVAKGAVTGVKNQGNCGSCWSFSTTGSLEGAYYLKYGQLLAFSEQELVSCDVGGADSGCQGGWMDNAFDFVKSNGGLTTEDAYPYTSGTTGASGSCVKTGYTNNANVAPKSYTDVEAGSVSALMSALNQQPVSIAIQANQLSFQHYSSGVLTGRCGQNLDHGVLAVGYGTDAATGVDYWKVKNSWGDSWGEAGFIRIERSDADLCGVLDAASFPNL